MTMTGTLAAICICSCAACGLRARRGARCIDGRRRAMSTFDQPLPDVEVNVPAPADFSTALAEGFARRVSALAQRGGASADAVRWAARGAFAASRATSEGHVCVPLDELAQRYDAEV